MTQIKKKREISRVWGRFKHILKNLPDLPNLRLSPLLLNLCHL